MRRQLLVQSCLLALAAVLATAHAQRRGLANLVWPERQTSMSLDRKLKHKMPDFPLHDPALARSAAGGWFQPEGVHVTPWQAASSGWTMLVSWQTGDSKLGSTSSPPPPYDPRLGRQVLYGLSKGQLNSTASEGSSVVYTYKYDDGCGGNTYQSPIIHHVLLKGLTPGKEYFYSVGNSKDGFSKELSLKVPPAAGERPIKIAVTGDLGQTPNSTVTLERVEANDPDLLLMLGDLSYADNYCSNGTECVNSCSDQRRWDAWARMTQRLASRVPMLHCAGNHEVEMQVANGKLTMTAYNARYPVPQDPYTINTSPNHAKQYLMSSGKFINEDWVQPNSSYYSADVSGVHIVSLSHYVPWGPQSKQHKWLVADLDSIDREQTPWVVVMFHAAPRHTYVSHYKEMEEFMELYEPLFYRSRVDLVLGGHTHAYERSFTMVNYTVDPCGPIYVCAGAGGNKEGVASSFIDHKQPKFCRDPWLFEVPDYMPSPSGETLLTFQDGLFCPVSQPEFSAHRDASFGHGLLTIHNATHAEWAWYRNQDHKGRPVDSVFIAKDAACSVQD